jgi:hypothetical protein
MITPLYDELERLIRELKPGFYGTVEVGVQNGKPDQVRITETFKLSNRTSRGTGNENLSR